MAFYRRILKDIMKSDSFTIEDLLTNSRALTILYIMKINNLFDDTLIKCNMFEINEKFIIQTLQLQKPTNNEIYDLILYLDSENELDNYMSLSTRLMPTYDRFYDDINIKIGLNKDGKKINTSKICPSCHLMPYYDFNDVCEICDKSLADIEYDDVIAF